MSHRVINIIAALAGFKGSGRFGLDRQHNQ